jgi:hypothetical protein
VQNIFKKKLIRIFANLKRIMILTIDGNTRRCCFEATALVVFFLSQGTGKKIFEILKKYQK